MAPPPLPPPPPWPRQLWFFLEDMPDPDTKADRGDGGAGRTGAQQASLMAQAAGVVRFSFCSPRAIGLSALSIAYGFANVFIASVRG